MGRISEILWGIGKVKGKLLILINPNNFLNSDQIIELKESKTSETLVKQEKQGEQLVAL